MVVLPSRFVGHRDGGTAKACITALTKRVPPHPSPVVRQRLSASSRARDSTGPPANRRGDSPVQPFPATTSVLWSRTPRRSTSLPASPRDGAEKSSRNEASAFQFLLVLSQNPDDLFALHGLHSATTAGYNSTLLSWRGMLSTMRMGVHQDRRLLLWLTFCPYQCSSSPPGPTANSKVDGKGNIACDRIRRR